jgi:hypothetical protein
VTTGGQVSKCSVQTADLILTREGLVLLARCEWTVGGLVANLKLRGLCHGVVVGTPHEQDGITNGRVDGKGHIA